MVVLLLLVFLDPLLLLSLSFRYPFGAVASGGLLLFLAFLDGLEPLELRAIVLSVSRSCGIDRLRLTNAVVARVLHTGMGLRIVLGSNLVHHAGSSFLAILDPLVSCHFFKTCSSFSF